MNSQQVKWISSDDPPEAFPDIETLPAEADGLVAAGGDLTPQRLLYAYRHGIFPWYEQGQPILWWSPDPRCVLYPAAMHLSKTTRRSFRTSAFSIRFNSAFSEVIAGCAEDRPGDPGTWITAEMIKAYQLLHEQRWAHSIEVWAPSGLVGGLYGLAIGGMFFGESMFSRASNASKAALFALCRVLHENNFLLFDCQVESPHVMTQGATLIPRQQFAEQLDRSCRPGARFTNWPEEALNISDLVHGKPPDALQ